MHLLNKVIDFAQCIDSVDNNLTLYEYGMSAGDNQQMLWCRYQNERALLKQTDYEAYYFRKNVDNGIQCDTIELFKRHLIKLINI